MKTPKRISFAELVDREARRIAEDEIERALRSRDLPLPKDSALEIHIEALLATKPEIRSMAELRVIAKQDAHSEGLKALGIEPSHSAPIELDESDLAI
jgi:hypothetical protein